MSQHNSLVDLFSSTWAELGRIAARSVGASSCVEIKKVSEEKLNRTFLLTMNDGNEVIARISHPNAGCPHFMTASEVATMDFVPLSLSLPLFV
jgi:hypothetical protein